MRVVVGTLWPVTTQRFGDPSPRSNWLPSDSRPELLALADDQAGVLSRNQLRDLGVDRDAIRGHVRARRWRLVGRAVVLHRGPLTAEQHRWVAVIHVGQDAALASLTAAEVSGLRGWASEQVHVVVRRGARVHPLPWMRVHISRRFSPTDVHPSRKPRQCQVERAVVDAATWKPNARLACAVLCSAVQQRIVTAGGLREVIEGAGAIAHRRAILAALRDIDGGSDAMSEIDLLRLCRAAGLPKPQQQERRRDSAGRWRYLDARLVRPDGRGLLIEVDGALHLDPRRWWDDQARSNDLVVGDDAMILRFPSVVLRTDRAAVIAQLRAAYYAPVRQGANISSRSA